jgi:hypothetical protein
LNNSVLHEDPAFEDVLKNFISSRLVEEDLDKIGDERMLKVVLLDQLMVEYLMGVQESLLDENAFLQQKHLALHQEKLIQEKALDSNQKAIADANDELIKKTEQLKQLKLYRQQINSFKCSYCSKIFRNMHFLERHMVKHEVSNLRNEREADLRVELKKKQELDEKRRLEEIELMKQRDKEKELLNLKSELDKMRSMLDTEHSDKANMENRMLRVNQELLNNIKKMESEIAEQNKVMNQLRSQQSELVSQRGSIIPPTPSNTVPPGNQPSVTPATPTNYPPNQNPQHPAVPEPTKPIDTTQTQQTPKASTNQPTPAVVPAPGTPSTQPIGGELSAFSSELIQLTNKVLYESTNNGSVIAPEVKTVPPLQLPHPTVVQAARDGLKKRHYNERNPVGTNPDQGSEATILDIISKELVGNKLMTAPTQQPQRPTSYLPPDPQKPSHIQAPAENSQPQQTVQKPVEQSTLKPNNDLIVKIPEGGNIFAKKGESGYIPMSDEERFRIHQSLLGKNNDYRRSLPPEEFDPHDLSPRTLKAWLGTSQVQKIHDLNKIDFVRTSQNELDRYIESRGNIRYCLINQAYRSRPKRCQSSR